MNDENMYIVLTFNKLNVIISETQEKKLRSVSLNTLVKLNGVTINTSSISAIPPLNEYYRQNPNLRPAPDNYKQIKAPAKIEMTQPRRIKILESMVSGFKRNYITQKNGVILEKLEMKLKKAKKGEEVNVNPAGLMV